MRGALAIARIIVRGGFAVPETRWAIGDARANAGRHQARKRVSARPAACISVC